MGLVTRNVGIIHIPLTGSVMYVYSRKVQWVHVNEVPGHEKAVDLRPEAA